MKDCSEKVRMPWYGPSGDRRNRFDAQTAKIVALSMHSSQTRRVCFAHCFGAIDRGGRWLIIECRSIGRVDVRRLKWRSSSEWKINIASEEGGTELRTVPRGWDHCPKEHWRLSLGNHRHLSTSFAVMAQLNCSDALRRRSPMIPRIDRSIFTPTSITFVVSEKTFAPSISLIQTTYNSFQAVLNFLEYFIIVRELNRLWNVVPSF